MTEPSRAVFLSYASQDAEAAQRICETLRAAGIEVWFDKSALRGGDAWDRSIRQQIHECSLFVPIISQHTHERLEGYFRLEWKLAVDRTHTMAEIKAFLVPVVIDHTAEQDPSVPEKFRELQWTRLPDGETSPAFVERIRGLLALEAPAASEGGRTASPVASRASATRGLIRRGTGVRYGAIAAAALLVVAYFGLERFNRSKPSAPAAASIAVLPLANESGEPSQQYFSDGISEDLITALSQFPGLKVIGRTSAFQFRDSKEDSRSIGAKLGVSHLLEGSVQRSGEIIRVSAELIDTADGTTQWSERYDRPYKDLFALQDEITGAVVGVLKAKLLPGQHAAAQSERPPGGSLEAYNELLQGRFYYSRFTEADWRKAIDYYTEATQLDPRYALAWSELARVWADLGSAFLEAGAPMQEAYAKGRQAVDRSLALSPDLAAAHLARGFLLLWADFDWRGSEPEYRRALELAPNDGEAKFFLGQQHATFGELQSAIELMQQAIATDPLQANWYSDLANDLSRLNRLDEAERAVRRAIELQPGAATSYSTLTVIEIQRGNAQAALDAARQETNPLYHNSALALAWQFAGDRKEADAALRTLIDKDANSMAYQIAQVYALRNDAKGTFEWLDRAWTNRDAGILLLLQDPFISRYKNDPRFSAYCRKVGLPVPGETSARKPT